MKITTTRFGEIEVEEDLFFKFDSPILGYEKETQFVMIEGSSNEKSPFKWLQSTNTPDLAFPITAPAYFGIEYVFELPESIQDLLEIKTAEDIFVLNIASIPHANPRKSTVNLLAPLIFNVKKHTAAQAILSGSGFKVAHPLFDDNKKDKEQ